MNIKTAAYSYEGGINLEDHFKNYNIGKKIQYLEDETNNLSIHDLTKNKNLIQKIFKNSHQDIPSFGYSKSSFWFKILLNNPKELNTTWVLSIDYLNLDYITFFQEENGIWKGYKTGDQIPFKNRRINQREFTLQITPIKGRKIIYIKIKMMVL